MRRYQLVLWVLAAVACQADHDLDTDFVADGPGGSRLVQPADLTLEPYAGRLRKLSISLAGETRPFLFDTGGGLTLIQPDMARLAGCSPHGRIVGFRMSGERVEFQKCGKALLRTGSLAVESDIAVFDLMELLPEGLPPLAGVASLHTFRNQLVTLDLKENRLTVETERSLSDRIDDMRELRLHLEHDMGGRGLSAYIEVRARVGTLRLLVDSGNLVGVILAPHALAQLGLPTEGPGDAQLEAQLEIVGLGPVGTSYVVGDITHDGVLGAEFLERIVLSMDLRRGRAWARLTEAEVRSADE